MSRAAVLRGTAFALVSGLLVAACGAASDDAAGGDSEDPLEEAAAPQAATYDSSVCAEIDVAPFADILGMTVPPLSVTTDTPYVFRCEARTEELLVVVQFRSNADHWDRIPEDQGEPLDLEPLEAYPPHETTGNLMVVRLERPWSVAVMAATQQRPDATDEQLEAVLRELAELGG